LDNTGVIEPDNDAPQEMGNPDAEVFSKSNFQGNYYSK
jgi:hypothetical protein